MMQRVEIFQGLGGDATHGDISDFYPRYLAALKLAIDTAEPFDTGWYGCKKEIQTARISCLQDPEKVEIQVSCGMDNTNDLIDTAIWEAFGKNDYAGSGYEAMRKRYPGATDAQIERAIERIQDRTHGDITMGDDNYAKSEKVIEIGSPEEAMEAIMATLQELAASSTRELKQRYQSLVNIIRDSMDNLMEEA